MLFRSEPGRGENRIGFGEAVRSNGHWEHEQPCSKFLLYVSASSVTGAAVLQPLQYAGHSCGTGRSDCRNRKIFPDMDEQTLSPLLAF